jgi:hypothetical protein
MSKTATSAGVSKKSEWARKARQALEAFKWNTFFVFRLKGEVIEGLSAVAGQEKRMRLFIPDKLKASLNVAVLPTIRIDLRPRGDRRSSWTEKRMGSKGPTSLMPHKKTGQIGRFFYALFLRIYFIVVINPSGDGRPNGLDWRNCAISLPFSSIRKMAGSPCSP